MGDVMENIQYFDWGNIKWIYEPDINSNASLIYIGISTILPGKRQREHIHYGDEQFLYVLSGVGRQLIGNELSMKRPEALFYIPAGSIHETINIGEEPIKEIILSIPVHYNQYNSLNKMLENRERDAKYFLKEIAINNKIFNLYNETLQMLKVPISIFNKSNETVIIADNFPEFCMKKCNVHQDIKNCNLYNIYDEYKPPHYKEPFAFVCEYHLRVFVMPIIINNILVGTIKGGHIRVYDKDNVNVEDKLSSHEKLIYDKIQIVHQGRNMSILQHIKILCKNIINYYLVEDAEMELNKKEEIIKDIAKKEVLLEGNLRFAREQVLNLQINNHFLFNTLNAIASLAITENSINTYESIIRLSKILRYALESSNNTINSLNDEFLFITDYLQLQKLRYGDRLNIKIDLPKDVKLAKVPFNFIQPIVENSFVHGFKNKLCTFNIEIGCKGLGEQIFIEIKDNGIRLEQERIKELNDTIKNKYVEGNISGLMMVYKKLELLYHDKFEFEVSNNKDIGIRTTIVIPLDKEEL